MEEELNKKGLQMKYYLVNVDASEICATADTIEELEKIGQENTWAYHITKSDDFAGLTAVDLAKIYNALPGTTEKVQRFSDRKSAVRRVAEALEGGFNEIKKGKAKKAKKERKPKEPKPEGEKPSRSRRAKWTSVSITPKGKTDEIRFQKNQPRSKVYEVVKEKGEISLDDLLAHCEKHLELKRGVVIAALAKLSRRGAVKVE